MRKLVIAVLFSLAVLAVLTCRIEHHSRYHYDTFRQEQFATTRVFGVPVHVEIIRCYDLFPGVYQGIMLKPPGEGRWQVLPPDCVRSLFQTVVLCHGSSSLWSQERRELIEAVFTKFVDDHDREHAASALASIDAVLPMPISPEVNTQHLDIDAINDLRHSLGLGRGTLLRQLSPQNTFPAPRASTPGR